MARLPRASHPPGTEFDSDPSVERFDVDASVADVVAAPALPTVPTAVISKANRSRSPRSKPDRPVLDRVCPEQQQSLVDLRPRTPHVIAMGSDHDVQVSNPDLVADIALLVIGRIAP